MGLTNVLDRLIYKNPLFSQVHELKRSFFGCIVYLSAIKK